MQIFLAALLGGLIQAAGSMAGRVLLALGIGYVTFSGISVVLNSLKSQVQAQIGGVPADIIGILGMLKIDAAVSIIFSAIAARLVIQGLVNGTIKRMVLK